MVRADVGREQGPVAEGTRLLDCGREKVPLSRCERDRRLGQAASVIGGAGFRWRRCRATHQRMPPVHGAPVVAGQPARMCPKRNQVCRRPVLHEPSLAKSRENRDWKGAAAPGGDSRPAAIRARRACPAGSLGSQSGGMMAPGVGAPCQSRFYGSHGLPGAWGSRSGGMMARGVGAPCQSRFYGAHGLPGAWGSQSGGDEGAWGCRSLPVAVLWRACPLPGAWGDQPGGMMAPEVAAPCQSRFYGLSSAPFVSWSLVRWSRF